MANTANTNFDYTYDGKLSTELFYKPSVEVPNITQIFTVRSGVKSKEQINIVNPLSKIVKSYSGCGGTFTSTGNAVNIENRTLETDEMEFRLEQCKDTFSDTILETLLPDGVEANELGETLQSAITTLIVDALARDNFRVFSFGDKADASTDYNQTDGLWKRIIDGTSSYCTTQIDTISALNQTSGTRAIDYFRNAYEGAPNILAQLPEADKKIFVTKNVFFNYLTNLEDKANASDGVKLVIEGGKQVAFFRGIEVVPVYAWDQYLEDTDNPFNGVFNTAILYTTPKNHLIGVGRASDQGQVEQWYEKKDRKVYFQGRYEMGYNYQHCDLQVFSIGNL